MSTLREDVQFVINAALAETQPRKALRNALGRLPIYGGRLRVLAIGKAAWSMAETAAETLHSRIDYGLVITKYGHSQGAIPGFQSLDSPVIPCRIKKTFGRRRGHRHGAG